MPSYPHRSQLRRVVSSSMFVPLSDRRRVRVLNAVVILVAAALACGGPASAETADDDFVGALASTSFSDVPRADLIALGHQTCKSLKSGATVDTVGKGFIDEGYEPEEAGNLIGAAVRYYCPDQQAGVDKWMSEDSDQDQ